jgi:hypothetical protein
MPSATAWVISASQSCSLGAVRGAVPRSLGAGRGWSGPGALEHAAIKSQASHRTPRW